MSRPPHKQWLKLSRLVGSVLAGYWIALCVATHIPVEWMFWKGLDAKQLMSNGGDKVIHLIAYFGLGFLLCFWTATRGRLTFSAVKTIAIVCVLYAMVDELLQIPVGRSADLMDCVADWCGAGLGIILFSILFRTAAFFRPSLLAEVKETA